MFEFEDRLAGAARIVGLDLADEERDVDVRRAGLHAGRVEAEIAAVGLDEGFVAGQRRMQVGKIAGVIVRLRRPAAMSGCRSPMFAIGIPSASSESAAVARKPPRNPRMQR